MRALVDLPFAKLFAAMVATYFTLVLAAPELWLRLAAKEGPIEHAGHLLLALTIASWIWVGVRAAGAARGLAVGVVVYLTATLQEEIDWGAVYGLDLGHSLVASITRGSPNFHNAQTAHASVLGWAVVWLSAPMLVFFGFPLLPLARARSLRARCSPACASVSEGVSFFVAAIATVVIDGLPLLERRLGYVPRVGGGDAIGGALGFFQMAFYAAWALVALRALRELRDRAPSAPPGPSVR